MIEIALLIAATLFAARVARGQQITTPDRVTAGTGATLKTSGSGSATFYLSGPATAMKKDVTLGESVALAPEDVRDAGRYTAIIRQGGRSDVRSFFVVPAEPAAVNFLARPSRVPVARQGAISGVAFVFDAYKNLVIGPADVTFSLAVSDAPAVSRAVPARDGIAFVKLDSGRKAGAAQFVASAGGAQVRRVVQQTASDPCNLRFRVQPARTGVTVETGPIKDCTGNPVPDGTIVTFTETDGNTRSTVDARIKRGVARAGLPGAPGATISVASGVVIGNEVRVRGGQ